MRIFVLEGQTSKKQFFYFSKIQNLKRINDFYNYITLPIPQNSFPFLLLSISILCLFYLSPLEGPKLKNELDYLDHNYNYCESFAFEIRESLSFVQFFYINHFVFCLFASIFHSFFKERWYRKIQEFLEFSYRNIAFHTQFF